MTPDPSRPHAEDPANALPRGTRLGEFELLRVMGIGGFGIVYLAFDHSLEREVAVKEYMPASMAGRTETLHVSVRSQSDAETFALGLKSFVNEGRLLARFDHPSLLKVLRFWEANGTAYMAMPVLRGQTLKAMRLAVTQPPEEAWVRGLLDPLLGAVERLHNEGVYHRDIAPDNIQIEPDGHPVLLDFGAARRVISDKSQNLTAILKPAYAPIEQYAEVGSVKQGPWTDLYALGATMYFLLLGHPPSPATARSVQDDVAPLAGLNLAGYSPQFLHLIDWMLAPRPADRPQSVAALRDVLEGRQAAPVRRPAAAVAPSQWDATIIAPRPPAPGHTAAQAQPGAADNDATVVGPSSSSVGHRPQALFTPPGARAAPTAATQALPPSAAKSASARLPLMAGAAALLLVAAVSAVMWWPGSRQAAAPNAAVSRPAPAGAPVGGAGPGTGAASPAAVPPAPPVQAATGAALAQANPLPAAQGVPAQPQPEVQPKPTAVAVLPATAAPATAAPAAQTPSPSTLPATAAKPPPAAERTQRIPVPPQRATALALPLEAAAPPSTTFTAPPAGSGRTSAAPAAAAPISPAAAEPVKPVATGPEATCSGKEGMSNFFCIERECLRKSLATHPDCLKWRASRPKENFN